MIEALNGPLPTAGETAAAGGGDAAGAAATTAAAAVVGGRELGWKPFMVR